MNSAHTALRDILLNATEVTDITSTIVPFAQYRNTSLPIISYQYISRENQYTYDSSTNIATDRLQLDCMSKDYDTAQSLVRALTNTVRDERDVEYDNIYIHRVRVDDLQDLPEEPLQGQEIPIYIAAVDVIVTYHLK